jgi:hypothetical protein
MSAIAPFLANRLADKSSSAVINKSLITNKFKPPSITPSGTGPLLLPWQEWKIKPLNRLVNYPIDYKCQERGDLFTAQGVKPFKSEQYASEPFRMRQNRSLAFFCDFATLLGLNLTAPVLIVASLFGVATLKSQSFTTRPIE